MKSTWHKLLFPLFVVILITSCPGDMFPQGAKNFRHYSLKEGLPSTVIYDCLQDQDGFMWFSTEQGVCRFDGNKFMVFSAQDGLPDQDVLNLFEDSKGRIWFFPVSGRLSFYQNGKIFNDLNTPFLKDANTGDLFLSWHETRDGTLLFGKARNGLCIIEGEKVRNLQGEDPNEGSQVKLIFERDAKVYFVGRNMPLFENENYYRIHAEGPSLTRTVPGTGNDLIVPHAKQGLRTVFPHNDTVKIQEGLAASKIIYLGKLKNKRCWAGYRRNGAALYEYDGKNLQLVEGPYLETESVSSIFEDKEGGIWLTTLYRGVYYLSNSSVTSYSETSIPEMKGIESISCFAWMGDTLLFPDNNGNILGLFKGNIITAFKSPWEIWTDTRGLQFRDPWLWIANNSMVGGINLENPQAFYKSFSEHRNLSKAEKKHRLGPDFALFVSFSNKALAFLPDSSVVWGTGNNLFRSEPLQGFDQPGIVRVNTLPSPWIYFIYPESNTRIWIGTAEGIKVWEKDSIRQVSFLQKKLHRAVRHITALDDGTLCMSTDGQGLWMVKDEQVTVIGEDDGLSSNNCHFSLLEGKNRLWVATNKGLSRITFSEDRSKKPQIRIFDNLDGLLEDNVQAVTLKNDSVYAIFNSGLSVFALSEMQQNASPPPIRIVRVRTGNQNHDPYAPLALSFPHKAVRIDFAGLSFKSAGNMLYRYRLQEADTLWSYSDMPSVTFNTLPYGSSTFQVQARNKEGIWSEEPAELKLSLARPFWDTHLFRALILLLIGALIWLVNVVRIGNIQKKMKKKAGIDQLIDDLEQKARRARMNPHFIFNSLQTIQGFIIKNDKKAAYGFLEKFGHLIRIIIEQSGEKTIRLKAEIDALEVYVNLERMRFENKFDYECQVEAPLKPEEVRIPSMLIQPFVENSILHGLLPKEGPGRLLVKCAIREERLYIMIEDNGIGRLKAQERKDQRMGHRSVGMNITQQRLEALNKQGNPGFSLRITDLGTEESPAGTRVELQIPLELEFSMENELGK